MHQTFKAILASPTHFGGCTEHSECFDNALKTFSERDEEAGNGDFLFLLATQRTTCNSVHNLQLSAQLVTQCRSLQGLVLILCKLAIRCTTCDSACNLRLSAQLATQRTTCNSDHDFPTLHPQTRRRRCFIFVVAR